MPFFLKNNQLYYFFFDSQTKNHFDVIKTNSVKYSGEEQKERDIKRTNEWSKNPFDTTPQNLEKWFMVCKNSPWVIKFWRFKFSEMMTTPCVNIMYTCRVFFPFFPLFPYLCVWKCEVFIGKLICFEDVEIYFSYWNKTRTTAAKVTYPKDLHIYLFENLKFAVLCV